MIRSIALLFCGVVASFAHAAGLPTQTWPAGTQLSTWNDGGRITTFHRGLLYLGGTDGQGTQVYDIENPLSPQLRCDAAPSSNGHTWQKIGDLFFRQYLSGDGRPPSQFVSLADPCNRVPWTQPIYDFPIDPNDKISYVEGWIETYPYWFENGVFDARLGWSTGYVSNANVYAMSSLSVANRFRIGNLLFLTPGDGNSGVAVFDIGNPAAPQLLDTLAGNYRQYTTAWQVWRHYLVMMLGEDANGPASNANTLVVDFSNPRDLRLVHTIPYDVMPGRYVHFQDEFAFAGRGDHGVKYNMETRQVVREFPVGDNGWYTDFQWIPLGHLLLVSGSEIDGSKSILFTHQDGLDTRAPSVGHHVPADGATNQSRDSAIGLVINEQLDSTTVNEQTIQLRVLGGAQVPAVVMHASWDVVNIFPATRLAANTTYEVRLVAGGVKDVAGNGIAATRFVFSTGATIGAGEPVVTAMNTTPATPLTAAQSTTFTAVANDPSSRPLEYAWTFGDGTPTTAFAASASASHAYARPGQYTVQVQVRNDASQQVSMTRVVVVRESGAASRSSASIAVHPTRREVFSTNPDHGTVAVFGADSMTRLGEVGVGAHPSFLAVDGAGRVWVANRGDDTLSRIDPVSRAVDSTLALDYGDRPAGIVFAPDGITGYVALEGAGEIARFSASANAVTARLPVGPNPHALSISADGSRLLASRFISGSAGGTIWRIALPAFAAATPIALATDTTTAESGTAGRGVPNYIAATALSSNGATAFYVGKKDNVLRGSFRENTPLTFETLVRTLLGTVDANAASETVAARFDMDDSSRPSAVALSPGASHLFVAHEGNNRVVAMDPWNRREIVRTEVGLAPNGLAFDPQTNRVFVANFLGRTVSVLDANALVTNGASTLATLATMPASATEPLAATVLQGKRHFYNAADVRMSNSGYAACATCHVDGRQDGRVWDFTQLGEGLRNTTSLRGGAGLAHGMLHWSANFDEVQDFEIPIRSLFGGIGFMDDAVFNAGTRRFALGDAKAGQSAALDALAAYVASLDEFDRSPHRTANGALTPDGVAGRAIFIERGCADCHAGAAFTDSGEGRSHDVGTIGPGSGSRLGAALSSIDTPTLRGLFDTAPYLHDGSAATLEDVLVARNASGKHGDAAGLSATQRAQLVSYLLQIDAAEAAMPNAPRLVIANPQDAAALPANAATPIAIATDYDDVAAVQYFADGVLVATASTAPWSSSFAAPPAGTSRTLQARVTHASGATTMSRTIRVTFVDPAVAPLFANGFE